MMDESHSADMDLCGAGGDPAPQHCGGDGNTVGNGLCHKSTSGPSTVVKQRRGPVVYNGMWTSSGVRVETCGTLKESWQEDEEELDGAQALGELEDSLDGSVDFGEMMKGFDLSAHPVQTKVLENVENEKKEKHPPVWKGKTDNRELTNQCLETSICHEEAFGSGLEADWEAGSKDEVASCGRWEQLKKEGQEEVVGLSENQADMNEGGRDAEMNVESGSHKSGGGKRSRGRSSGDQSQQQMAFSSSKSLTSGGRHKQAKRRHHHHHHHHQGKSRGNFGSRAALACREFLSESLPPWCLSCIRMIVELIVLVAHQCREVVEAGGALLYESGSQLLSKAKDLRTLRAEAWCFMGRVWYAGVAVWTRAVSFGRSGWQRFACCVGVFYKAVLLGSRLAGSLLDRLAGERAQAWGAAFLNSSIWKYTAVILKKIQSLFGRCDPEVSASHSESSRASNKCHPGKQLERLLGLAHIPDNELDPFVVLGVEDNATDPELKRAYRQLAVQVHPDKNKHPRAGEAFKVLRAAWDIVSNPETYRQYQLKRMAESELSRSMNEFLTKLQDDLKEAMNTMMCTKCEGKHRRFEIERDPAEARFCAECNKHHSAEDGDFWAESSMLGLRITYFSFMDGKVYDITEWAGCQRISITPDTHRVPYHISFGAKNHSNTARHRAPSNQHPGPNSAADLQDFFSRIFQGQPPSGMAANGTFFPPGAAPQRSAGAGGGSPPSATPPHTGFFSHWGQRADSSEPRTESSKPVRRRKKARKPFQR
ncbi:dnaJ homolog subfamily C member 14 [Paramormyrops kingsleyae]|uniref:dnaJ homolog subfamily C member 14 n=1 Tax=Paramormyrops kingsleyae TaxID=1676925 RepID=UPI003B96F2D7